MSSNPIDIKDKVPEDIKHLTIKNLDTNEEYIIGENDPDFEFDTFELHGGYGKASSPKEIDLNANAPGVWTWLFGKSKDTTKGNTLAKNDEQFGTEDTANEPVYVKPKTPYSKLSSFVFRRELGRGAFGRVLLAESKIVGTRYAMKILNKKNMRSSDKKQAMAERDILHAMAYSDPHPFTTGLKFAFQSANNLYIGMDYYSGGNLKQLIQRFGRLPEDWVRIYSAELVLALSHLHSLNVVYRDIKPHNVMIDSSGHIVLIDYGLSKQEVSGPRGAQSLVGTPDYSAPEVHIFRFVFLYVLNLNIFGVNYRSSKQECIAWRMPLTEITVGERNLPERRPVRIRTRSDMARRLTGGA